MLVTECIHHRLPTDVQMWIYIYSCSQYDKENIVVGGMLLRGVCFGGYYNVMDHQLQLVFHFNEANPSTVGRSGFFSGGNRNVCRLSASI